MRGHDFRRARLAPDRVADGGGSFSRSVQQMFDVIAPRYDAFNRWASLGLDVGWRRAAIRELDLVPNTRLLDVATGTGDLALTAARAGACAVGCDFVSAMVLLARGKAAFDARTASRTAFHVARAEALPYADRSFARLTSAFAMRNVRPMLDDVLAEALRVLEPGGRMVILEFSEPQFGPIRWGHRIYTRWVMPRIGRMVIGPGEPFDYLQRSIMAWEAPELFAERIEQAGFQQVGFRRLSLGTVALHWGVRPPA